MAILKLKARHSVAKQGSGKRRNSQILIRRGATPRKKPEAVLADGFRFFEQREAYLPIFI